MSEMQHCRLIKIEDHKLLREIYSDAIESQGETFYSQEQIKAWSSLAWLPGVLEKTFLEGQGWLSFENHSAEAFAMRYPLNRLALLYCRGRSSRKGHASHLLQCVELDALSDGQKYLYTEASLFSSPLLKKRGWTVISPEHIEIAGVSFTRYRMVKKL